MRGLHGRHARRRVRAVGARRGLRWRERHALRSHWRVDLAPFGRTGQAFVLYAIVEVLLGVGRRG